MDSGQVIIQLEFHGTSGFEPSSDGQCRSARVSALKSRTIPDEKIGIVMKVQIGTLRMNETIVDFIAAKMKE